MILINPLFTRNFTQVECEDKEEQKFNAPHHFIVKEIDPVSLISGKTVAMVNFQEGPIKECGINGISNEDALLMVLTRLESFQDTDWKCKENEMAITKIQEAVMWLRKRTLGREIKGIEGTSKK